MDGPLGENPYRPGVGLRPEVFAGRKAELAEFERALQGAPAQTANFLLAGLRGVGKSVLLDEFVRHADSANWAALKLELRPEHAEAGALVRFLIANGQSFREALLLRERIRRVAKRVVASFKWKIEDISFTFDPAWGEPNDLAKEIVADVEAALDRGYDGVVLLLDEAQVIADELVAGSYPMSLLLATIAPLQSAGVPIGLVLCGLPSLRKRVMKARSYSERLFRQIGIGRLKNRDDEEAFVGPLRARLMSADQEMVDEVLGEVRGYAYFIQFWGAELWERARDREEERFSVQLLDETKPLIYTRLDRDFFRPRLEQVGTGTQRFTLQLTEVPYPPLVPGTVAVALSMPVSDVDHQFAILEEENILFDKGNGEFDFTAPLFMEFLQRATLVWGTDEWDV